MHSEYVGFYKCETFSLPENYKYLHIQTYEYAVDFENV
jgi:hypothetical protein